MRTLQYTIQSTNEDNFGTIKTCLEAPASPYTRLNVSGLTTLCSMVLLGHDDYIAIDNIIYQIEEEYSDLNSVSLTELLSKLLADADISVTVDGCNRLVFEQICTTEFSITGASYNMKQITGMYNSKFPIVIEECFIHIKSVRFNKSTPILYLISNVGE